MTSETCVDFIRNSTNDQSVTANDQRVVKLFQDYDRDKDGQLTKEEFVEFYRDKSKLRQDTVWANLASHNYNGELRQSSFN